MLQADVLALGVFTDDDQVQAGPMGGHAGKILDRAKVGEELELLAQGNVDALEAAADGCGDRALESDLVTLDGIAERGRNIFAVDFEGLSAGGKALPAEFDAGGFKDADDGLRNFGTDAVAGNKSYFVSLLVRHCFLSS